MSSLSNTTSTSLEYLTVFSGYPNSSSKILSETAGEEQLTLVSGSFNQGQGYYDSNCPNTAVKNEYGNAQLECTAADEHAKLLASEVIGLEEKALRLRSSELKLEKQLEKSQAEISSLIEEVDAD